jgi:hypothetical protein
MSVLASCMMLWVHSVLPMTVTSHMYSRALLHKLRSVVPGCDDASQPRSMLRPLLDSATNMAVKCCRSILVALLAALAWRTLRVAPLPPPLPPPPPPLPDFFSTADGLAVLQPADLRLFVGRDHQLIYLAIIGDVFDVTTGSRHAPTPSVHMPCCQPSPNAWPVQALRARSLVRALCGVRLLARVRHRPRRWQGSHGRPLWP